jgi:hypothetical protein
MALHPPLKIELVTSPADLEAVYRLRFGQVGLPEDNLEAPESLMFRDMLDTPAATILAVKTGSEIVGTMRMVPRSAGPFIMDDTYGWPELSAQLGLELEDLINQTILYDRGVVHPDFQGYGLLGILYKRAARIAQAIEKKYIVATSSSENISLKISIKKGFKEFAQHECEGYKRAVVFASVEDIINSR